MLQETLRKYSSREIIKQLGNILSHPANYWQEEKLPGVSSAFLLERYRNEGFEIHLRCNRNKQYLRRWYLSRVLTEGKIGEQEMILATIIFTGNSPIERLFQIIVKKTINRKTNPLKETYELCRSLYTYRFPVLPNVKDPLTRPIFQVLVERPQPRMKIRKTRIRNPSAVGGRHSQGVKPLPMEPVSGEGPSNVDELFLETYNFLGFK
jgi:hypothetical protein